LLRATAVTLTLSETDLEEALAGFATGSVQDLRVELAEGALLLRLRVPVEAVRMAVPVELRFTVIAAAGNLVKLGVSWTNMGLVPGFLKEMALQKAFEALPGEYQDGVYRLDLSEVLEHVPVSFRLKGVRIDPLAVTVELSDVMAFPIDTSGLALETPGALVPVPSREEQPIPEHQGFYQSLREQVRRYASSKAPQWAQPLIPWLLAVPDFFVMLVRLARDERVPPGAKVIAGATVAYFLSPIDLIPDPIPLIGEIDDLGLALLAVEQMAKLVPREVLQEAWPGEGDVLELVQAGLGLISRVLPNRVLTSLQKVLKR
jgi:Protein of unknown function (DUF1232).